MATIEDRYEYKTNEMPAMACRKWGHPQRFTSDSLQLTAFQSCVCVPSKIPKKKSASNSFKDSQANLPHQGPPSAARSAGHEAESAPTSTELNQKSIASNPSSSKTVPLLVKKKDSKPMIQYASEYYQQFSRSTWLRIYQFLSNAKRLLICCGSHFQSPYHETPHSSTWISLTKQDTPPLLSIRATVC